MIDATDRILGETHPRDLRSPVGMLDRDTAEHGARLSRKRSNVGRHAG